MKNQIKLDVTGMSCGSCVARVEKAVTSLPAVDAASANLTMRTVTVDYDDAKVTPAALVDAINKLGYAAMLPAARKRASFGIKGMSCASCVARVEATVGKIKGVESAVVNLAAENITLSFDANAVTLSLVREQISRLGYEPLEPQEETAAAELFVRKNEEISALAIKLAGAMLFGFPLLLMAMLPMLGVPLPAFMDPGGQPLTFACVQLTLAAGVAAVGYQFYTKGFMGLLRGIPTMDSLIALGTASAFLYSAYNTWMLAP